MGQLKAIGWTSRAALDRLRCKIAQRFGLDAELLNAPTERDELQGIETVTGPPCVVIPGQFERVSACAFGVDIVQEVAQVQGAARNLEPTLRYVLEDVLVDGGIIFRNGRQKMFNPELPSIQPKSQWEQYDEVVLRSSLVGCYYFGHWLRDDCATHLLAERAGTPMSMPTPSWPDRASYLAVFGQSCKVVQRAHVKRMILFHDISQNTHKTERLRALRAKVIQAQTSQQNGRVIYLRRGQGGRQRTILNEPEIIEALASRGVVVVQAESLAVPELIRKLLGARIIMSVEGSQLSHALYTLRDGGGLLVIQPPDRFFNSHMDWVRALGMRYGIVVGELRDAGFHLPTDDLLRTLDKLDAELA